MYVYCADTYCDSCGKRLRREIAAHGFAPADPDDVYVDSDSWPQPALEESTDGPDHCGSDGDCLEAIDLSEYGEIPYLVGAEERKIGALLSDGLTAEGVEYLKGMLDDDHHRTTAYQKALHAYWREAFSDEL